ncbi:MAG: hypothetical protein AB7E81_04975 [Hyphomicrobiaceae bacterium]
MTGGRILILLIVTAATLLAAALAISTGDGGATASAAHPTAGGGNLALEIATLASTVAPASRGEMRALLIGFLAGWLLRWIYALPWANVPRAIGAWLLSWRTSAAMVGLALGCTVILLFY